jgi:chromosome segregation ATPase
VTTTKHDPDMTAIVKCAAELIHASARDAMPSDESVRDSWREAGAEARAAADRMRERLALAERANGALASELQAVKERAERNLAACHAANRQHAAYETAYRQSLAEQAKRASDMESDRDKWARKEIAASHEAQNLRARISDLERQSAEGDDAMRLGLTMLDERDARIRELEAQPRLDAGEVALCVSGLRSLRREIRQAASDRDLAIRDRARALAVKLAAMFDKLEGATAQPAPETQRRFTAEDVRVGDRVVCERVSLRSEGVVLYVGATQVAVDVAVGRDAGREIWFEFEHIISVQPASGDGGGK